MLKKSLITSIIVFFLVIFGSIFIATTSDAGYFNNQSNQISFFDAASSGYPPPLTEDFNESLFAYPPPNSDIISNQQNPTEPDISDAAKLAIDWVKNNYALSIDFLEIVDDHLTKNIYLERDLQVVTILDNSFGGKIYKLIVDAQNGQIYEDYNELLEMERLIQQSKYGKLQPSLYDKLQLINENDLVPVAIWCSPSSQDSLSEIQNTILQNLMQKYPETLRDFNGYGKPFDISDLNLATKIEVEYLSALSSIMEARITPLLNDLSGQGYEVIVFPGMPSISATLSKNTIINLSYRSDIDSIYLVDAKPISELDSAVPNSLAPNVWASGYDGNGVSIAILENSNIDPNNSFLNLTYSRASVNGISDHATRVASDSASFHNIYKGVAKGASVISAGHANSEVDTVLALQWAFNQGARIVNMSEGFQYDENLNWTDRAFDYWARASFRFISKASGNIGGSISSPGKGWNIMTVGAYDDLNNTNWLDDIMWADSSYVNPISANSDREKPEIVAVGVNVTSVGMGDVIHTFPGTSHAAPQVAGLAALLVDRNSSLGTWPESMRAIIMTSATHNIEGSSIIITNQGDLKDGAGAINADYANQIAQIRGTASGICYSSCWWGEDITNTGFPVNTDITRNFYVSEKSLVRATIAWWANADSPTNNYLFSRLDTDLDLRILDPNDQFLYGVNSFSYDNNYEMVQFLASEIGEYKIVIHKTSADENSNYLGVGVLLIPMPNSIYLPIVQNDF